MAGAESENGGRLNAAPIPAYSGERGGESQDRQMAGQVTFTPTEEDIVAGACENYPDNKACFK